MQHDAVKPGTPGYVDPKAYKAIVSAQVAAIDAFLAQMAAAQASQVAQTTAA